MANSSLTDFVRSVEASRDMQAMIAGASGLDQILDVASREGFSFTAQDLRAVSRDLSAPYWPWAAKGHAFRRQFFDGPATAD